MELITVQTTTKRLAENGDLLDIAHGESYLLTPTSGKVLQHKQTKQIFYSSISLNSKNKKELYTEIEDPRL